MGLGRDRAREPWIYSQTRIYCQTRFSYTDYATRPGLTGVQIYIGPLNLLTFLVKVFLNTEVSYTHSVQDTLVPLTGRL